MLGISMNPRDYEAAVTTGNAHWFASFDYDATNQRLVVGLTRDPETSKTDRILEFHQVKTIHDHWIERDDESMEGLLGAHEEQRGSDVRYLLATDQREIEIVAGTHGLIYDAYKTYAANPRDCVSFPMRESEVRGR